MFSRGSIGRSPLARVHPLARGNFVIDAGASASVAVTAQPQLIGRLALAAAPGAGIEVAPMPIRRQSIGTQPSASVTISPKLTRMAGFGAVSSLAVDASAVVLRRQQFGTVAGTGLSASASLAWHILNLGAARRRMVMRGRDTRMMMSARARLMTMPAVETRADHPEWRQMQMPSRARSMVMPPQSSLDMPTRRRSA